MGGGEVITSTEPHRTLPKKQRQSRGRSRAGCQECLSRHRKCDEGRPICRNCIRGGRECHYARDAASKRASTVLVPKASLTPPNFRNATVHERYDKLLNRTLPIMVSNRRTAYELWSEIVLPASQSNSAVLNAVLAVETMYEIPLVETLRKDSLAISRNIQGRYRKAIEWYCQSVNQSLTAASGDDSAHSIVMVLVNTMLFCMVELRQGNYKNMERLACAAFAAIHYSRDKLCSSKSVPLLMMINALIQFPCIFYVGISFIPKAHLSSAFIVGLQLAFEVADDLEFYQLRFELLGLICTYIDTIDGELPEHNSVDIGLLNWYRRFVKWEYSSGPSTRTLRIRTDYQIIHTSRQMYHDKGKPLNVELLEKRFDQLEAMLVAPDKPGKLASPLVFESYIIPFCLDLAWYCRVSYIHQRLKESLERFKVYNSKLVGNTINYFDILLKTPYMEATDLEMDLFGRQPKALLLRHAHMISHRLIRDAT